MGRISNHTRVILAGFLAIMLLAFQNCSHPSPSSQSISGHANGESYGGMVSYVSRTGAGTCADGSQIVAEIQIQSNQSAELIRSACQNITPQALALPAIGLRPYNSSNLVYNERAFDILAVNVTPTGVFCRASSPEGLPVGTSSNTPAFEEADFQLKNFLLSGAQPFPGQVISGLYDSQMNFLSTQSSGSMTFQEVTAAELTVSVTAPANVSNVLYYQGTSSDGLTTVALLFGTASDGTLQGQVATQTAGAGPAVFNPEQVYPYNGPVTCYEQ